ncbi:YbaB/EbfC family nucleoid-associated protein [Streptomyces justiciae]|uniref:YbaB/EbfC family nucleoid-associated protein n=1 Tax=Streptomyces justiciae TaxID=2780140 RepID=UPI0018814CA0|nr:YbaB/EbfC family nucleoid-associated protein [Streptomyces justiciae]MBE8478028.1 YbaB/EbfC family nucleoid-associated protein [Streptomyces justiciae]MCW8383711.1 YbaB/EbfC family nucleoid-associated protein [Streptomyces justiciae]
METPPVRRLERALADFAERYKTLSRAREQMRALSVTARSRDDVVEVTVSADGSPARIRFVDERFRQVPAAQLGDSVVEALGTAQAEATARISALVTATWLRLPPPAEPRSWEEPLPLGAIPAQACEPAREAQRPRPQGPLWGRGSSSAYAPLPPELRAAVLALTDSVCDAVKCV